MFRYDEIKIISFLNLRSGTGNVFFRKVISYNMHIYVYVCSLIFRRFYTITLKSYFSMYNSMYLNIYVYI